MGNEHTSRIVQAPGMGTNQYESARPPIVRFKFGDNIDTAFFSEKRKHDNAVLNAANLVIVNPSCQRTIQRSEYPYSATEAGRGLRIHKESYKYTGNIMTNNLQQENTLASRLLVALVMCRIETVHWRRLAARRLSQRKKVAHRSTKSRYRSSEDRRTSRSNRRLIRC